ncbi:phosphoribosyl transferase domain protein [Lasiosphaeris hirsuta]|uniref:Phosphoribosyl transferase domain protein n=1 Tax=Lasiosphaeris hirsuta TaxID=260670 RepID=A0AA40A3P2_9PEZI|nr:phosphoribosyl transferase domain protein [Lasiosphaeris hirsuta]
MATLHSLKSQLGFNSSDGSGERLSDAQYYGAAFDTFTPSSAYQNFIIPQLSQLVTTLLSSRTHISVLEVGPGPWTALKDLPIRLRQRIKRYAALQPNSLLATGLEEWFHSTSPLPSLEGPPDIRRIPFHLDGNQGGGYQGERFDLVLFCHSVHVYGISTGRWFVERALEMLDEQVEGGMVAVFHYDGLLEFDGLVCHTTASYPTGVLSVADDDEMLDCFSRLLVGFTINEATVRAGCRLVCRSKGRHEEADQSQLRFSSAEVMVAFTRRAVLLPELALMIPSGRVAYMLKNPQARLNDAALALKPESIPQIQQCVRWALTHGFSLTVLGGGHSGHCILPNMAAVDMGAFNKVHVLLAAGEDGDPGPIIVAEAGCTTGDIIRQAMAMGLTAPLGARPSVGAGLWLQGGIGHLARLHGLACDAIVGAVVVGVDSGAVLCVGHVPSSHWPAGATRPANESELLWAIKGAGTNFGIVVSVTFRAYAAPTYSVRNWVLPLRDSTEARRKLGEFDELVAKKLARNCSADAYLYWDDGHLRLGVTMFESSHEMIDTPSPKTAEIEKVFGPEDSSATVDGVGVFESEMYMSGMHGGHGGGKTSAFKRCLFLKNIGSAAMVGKLLEAVETRPSPLCYLHLLHGGGGAVSDVAGDATAFGCRDWEFACVITGVWPRGDDGTNSAQAVIRWVYTVAEEMLPLSSGAYGADLGPDPRDAALASTAFGPNRWRLARLKHTFDPQNVLAYACPLPRATEGRKARVMVAVSGESCAGKDFCAAAWVSLFTEKHLTARAVSISDVTKREYAIATGADLDRLLGDRAYKEQHRPALTAFFQAQVQRRPRLPEEHFLHVVNGATDVDVLFVTGMRDEAPVAAFSHLLPGSRLLGVRVEASEETRQFRRGCKGDGVVVGDGKTTGRNGEDEEAPNFIFRNDTAGNRAAEGFAEERLLPFFHDDLRRLDKMVCSVPDFPRPGIEFRHVLNISQQPGGLALCASLLQAHFTGDWAKIDAVVCCEAGGYVFASALALVVNVPLVLIREGGKLPPPTVTALKSSSHISSVPKGLGEKNIEMGRDVMPRGASVVVVDDVLATGKTLCAVLQLLVEGGVGVEDVSVMAVAEFPVHRGRELLRRGGFGKVKVQSLLIFDGL